MYLFQASGVLARQRLTAMARALVYLLHASGVRARQRLNAMARAPVYLLQASGVLVVARDAPREVKGWPRRREQTKETTGETWMWTCTTRTKAQRTSCKAKDNTSRE